MIYTAVILSALPAFVAAANTIVQVASGATLTFTPNAINASTGDVITFLFDAPGHSVTQSTLADPCTPANGGFNSGFSTAANTSWDLTIANGSAPIWFFCAQSQPLIHCEKGMVGSINAPSEASISSFSAGAAAATVSPSITAVQLSGLNAAASAPIGSFSGSVPSVTPTSPAGTSTGTGTSAAAATSTKSPAQKLTVGLGGAGSALLALLGAALL